MINFIYQGFAVSFRTLLIFLFLYLVNNELDSLNTSKIIAEFTYSSIFANIICFGFDYSFIQDDSKKVDLKSFLLKIFFGLLISILIILILNLSHLIIFYSVSLSLPLMFKGYVRLMNIHKLDFSLNLICLILFVLLIIFFEPNTEQYLILLSFSIFIVFFTGLVLQLKFINKSNFSFVIDSFFRSLPLMIYALFSYLLSNIDVYFFEFLGKLESYNIYAISNKFFLNLSLAAVVLSNYRINFIFNEKYSKRYFLEFICLGLFISIIIFFIADEILYFIFSGEYTIGYKELLVFCIILFVRFINTYLGIKVLKLISNWKRLIIMIITLLLHCILLYVLITKYDWRGALYANFLSISLLTFLNFYYTYKLDK